MRKLLILPLIALAAPALGEGFNAQSLGQAAAAAKADPAQQMQDIAEATERLRLGLAYDAAAALGARHRGERETLSEALGTGDLRSDLRATWFAAGAILQRTTNDEALLYNPLARGWLALRWAKIDGDWRIVDAEVKSAGAASWTTSPGPYRKAFADDYAAARGTVPADGGNVSADTADQWLAGLAKWLQQPGGRTAMEKALTLIVRGKTAALGSPALDLLPEKSRAAFGPTGAIPRSDGGTTLFFGSPLIPSLIVTADFGVGETPTLQNLNLLNLDHAGDVQ